LLIRHQQLFFALDTLLERASTPTQRDRDLPDYARQLQVECLNTITQLTQLTQLTQHAHSTADTTTLNDAEANLLATLDAFRQLSALVRANTR